MYGIWIPTLTRTKSPSHVGKHPIHGAYGCSYPQWIPSEEPKLEVPTIYEVYYFSGPNFREKYPPKQKTPKNPGTNGKAQLSSMLKHHLRPDPFIQLMIICGFHRFRGNQCHWKVVSFPMNSHGDVLYVYLRGPSGTAKNILELLTMMRKWTMARISGKMI